MPEVLFSKADPLIEGLLYIFWGLAGALANYCFVSNSRAPLPGWFLHPSAEQAVYMQEG